MTQPTSAAAPAINPPPNSQARQVLLGNFAGHLFAATARQAPRTLRLGAVLPSPRPSANAVTADLVVANGPARLGYGHMTEAVVIVEVLGPATEETVRRTKLPVFRAQPTCREIVLVQEHRLYCEIHRRLAGERWITDLLLDRDARLRLEAGGLDLPLGTLYAHTGLNPS